MKSKNNEELRSQLKATEEKSEALSEEQSKLEKERAHVILDAKNEANHIVAATKNRQSN